MVLGGIYVLLYMKLPDTNVHLFFALIKSVWHLARLLNPSLAWGRHSSAVQYKDQPNKMALPKTNQPATNNPTVEWKKCKKTCGGYKTTMLVLYKQHKQ